MKRLKIIHSTCELLPPLDHSIPGVGWVWWELSGEEGRRPLISQKPLSALELGRHQPSKLFCLLLSLAWFCLGCSYSKWLVLMAMLSRPTSPWSPLPSPLLPLLPVSPQTPSPGMEALPTSLLPSYKL